ncbi:non-canonical purine NTP pyrophosphatase [Paucilactobacillus kaifaensis]|uniref:non-canonical purine NTP pyrophosphatase n=1 Tax=Paucilactobacillus kaifaensis TaxID=2559921 RepID=UPI0010FA24C7|nr:non-canonical purine NTP pyrophosphatase [Paucilactobacillus kaifaensis]
MKSFPTFIIASNNKSKTEELIKCFRFLGLQAKSYQDEIDVLKFPPEGTKTYLANARKKARFVAQYLPDQWIVADDSGMVLQALPKRLGVTTARQLEPYQDVDDLNQKVLKLVAGKSRLVKMIAQLVLVTPDKGEFGGYGEFNGTVATSQRGTNGSSFDLILEPQGMKQTIAQLPDQEKIPMLHRTKAILDLISKLEG